MKRFQKSAIVVQAFNYLKKLSASISGRRNKLDDWWRALPLKKQQRYTLLLFSGYAVLTIGMILKVGYDIGKSGQDMSIKSIGHIENPALKKKESAASVQDSILIILKNKMYER